MNSTIIFVWLTHKLTALVLDSLPNSSSGSPDWLMGILTCLFHSHQNLKTVTSTKATSFLTCFFKKIKYIFLLLTVLKMSPISLFLSLPSFDFLIRFIDNLFYVSALKIYPFYLLWSRHSPNSHSPIPSQWPNTGSHISCSIILFTYLFTWLLSVILKHLLNIPSSLPWHSGPFISWP